MYKVKKKRKKERNPAISHSPLVESGIIITYIHMQPPFVRWQLSRWVAAAYVVVGG